jgi:hypothetical protein
VDSDFDMSQLTNFYRNEGVDSEGRTIVDILTMPSDQWEGCHDFVQWVFPLPEPSQFNADAPLLTDEDRKIFQEDPIIRHNVGCCWAKFLDFLGLDEQHTGDSLVVLESHFLDKQRRFWGPFNHNHLRITRVLRFMTLVGFQPQAKALYDFLDSASYIKWKHSTIPQSCFEYWTAALDPNADFFQRMKILYEIWWKYPTRKGSMSVPLKENLDFGPAHGMYRHQVISTNRSILEKTIERLKIISPSDYEFEIKKCGTSDS